ncbi:MAG: type IV pilin protein [Rudaea sp.]
MTRVRHRGFTLLEAMVVVAILALLASIALPSYASYVRRSRILEAVARLSDARARMEEWFLDQRTYLDDTGHCAIAPASANAGDAFTLSCIATATTFTYTATGNADKGMDRFAYTIDQTGARSTASVPAGWSRTPECWTIRADGLCV